jgi:hypothetical protein
MFPTSGKVYVWRTPKEAYNPEYLVATVKHGGGSVMFWAAVSWHSILLVPVLAFMAELLQGSTYIWTGWVIRCISLSRRYFQTVQFSKTAVLPFTAGTVQPCFEEHESELQHLPRSAQSPDLNIIEPP